MTMNFNPNGLLLGSSNANTTPSSFLNKRQSFRAAGPIEEYHFDNIKPKKQLKEIRKVLLPEKKKFLFLKFGYKYNLKNRCVVCGTHHEWEISDPYRPGIPLHEVTKGRPLRGTYCSKHAVIYKQMEMLEQQILADEHGLEFKKWIPRPKVPQMLQSGPIKQLRPADIASLTAIGWTVKPPSISEETPDIEYSRLMLEIETNLKRVNFLVQGEKKEGE
jgi:hypothetical protein